MSNLARMSLEKVYKQQPVPYNRGKLEFMTLEQVEERNRKSLQKAKHRMQMPPILQVKSFKQTYNCLIEIQLFAKYFILNL